MRIASVTAKCTDFFLEKAVLVFRGRSVRKTEPLLIFSATFRHAQMEETDAWEKVGSNFARASINTFTRIY